MKNERHQRSTQIFKLAYQGKQFDVLTSKYKEFDKPEDLLEWLQDFVDQKELGFHIEDDDSREAAWLQEKKTKSAKVCIQICLITKLKNYFSNTINSFCSHYKSH